MTSLGSDLRFALRTWRRRPGFAVLAILTLTLGIGINNLVFAVVRGVLLEALPYPEPERLVALIEANPARGIDYFSVSPMNFIDYRERCTSFDALAGSAVQDLALRIDPLDEDDGAIQRHTALQVTVDYFSVFGIAPVLGRGFRDVDFADDAGRVLVLSHGTWTERFEADPEVLGRDVVVAGLTTRVVGVMPEDFREAFDFFIPLRLDPAIHSRGLHWINVMGRLMPGVSMDDASQEVTSVANQLEALYPGSNRGWTAFLEPLHGTLVYRLRAALWILQVAVALVLVLACVNLQGLLLARLASREREMALRSALGADRRRLARQVVQESLLLSTVGGGLGYLLALGITGPLVAAFGTDLPRQELIRIDPGIFFFSLALATLAGVIFGLPPALHASQEDVQSALGESGPRHTSGIATQRLRRALILVQVAITVVLLIGATLLVRSLLELTRVDPGFEAPGALLADLELPPESYPAETLAETLRSILGTLSDLPEGQSAVATYPFPLTGRNYVLDSYIEGDPPPPTFRGRLTHIRGVGLSYFEAMGIHLVAGREFTPDDFLPGSDPVVIVSESAAEYWQGDALGQAITLGDPQNEEARWSTVVGVVKDIRHQSLRSLGTSDAYYPFPQTSMRRMVVMAQGDDPAATLDIIRERIRAIDPDLPLHGEQPVEALIDQYLANPRFNSVLFGLFGLLAALLAGIGIYALISQIVTQRTRELGIRIAFGASRAGVAGLVLRQAMAPVLQGLLLGTGVALAMGRLFEGLVYAVSPADPTTYLWVACGLAAIAAIAAIVPVLRIFRLEANAVLREE